MRYRHGGGVFLACKNTIACKHIEFDTDCELLVCEAELPNHSPFIIAALYQPPIMILSTWKISVTL